MELFSSKLEFLHLLIGDFEAPFVDVGIDFALHSQARRRCRCGDEVDDDLMADQWFRSRSERDGKALV